MALSFVFTFRYIDDGLSLTNSKFGDYVDRLSTPTELEIKDTTETERSVFNLELHLEIDGKNRTLRQER